MVIAANARKREALRQFSATRVQAAARMRLARLKLLAFKEAPLRALIRMQALARGKPPQRALRMALLAVRVLQSIWRMKRIQIIRRKLLEAARVLQKGAVMLKYKKKGGFLGTNHEPHRRFVWLSGDMRNLCWCAAIPPSLKLPAPPAMLAVGAPGRAAKAGEAPDHSPPRLTLRLHTQVQAFGAGRARQGCQAHVHVQDQQGDTDAQPGSASHPPGPRRWRQLPCRQVIANKTVILAHVGVRSARIPARKTDRRLAARLPPTPLSVTRPPPSPQAIGIGAQTTVLKKMDNPGIMQKLVEKRKDGTIDENAFSIIVPGIWDADTQKILPERRLDLYAESKSEREAWAKALKVHLSPRR